MSATEELRRLLDERGVQYKRHYLNTSWYAGMKLYMATDDMDGTLTVDNLTPEQAIAATLGRPESDFAAWNTRHQYGLTNEDYSILLDELGVSERTCANLVDETDWFECSACGVESSVEWCGSGYGTPKYCPNCGAKVVGE